MADPVTLRLPAGAEYGRVARVTTAALARRHGFTYREVEDLRLAVDEALIAVVDPARGGAIEIAFGVRPGRIEIVVTGARDRPAEAIGRFHTLVAELVDTADLELGEGRARLRKRSRAP